MTIKIDHQELWQFITELFNKVGSSPEDAALAADALVKAELRGLGSHGVGRVPTYIKRMEENLIHPTASLTTIQESDTTALLDGGYNLGQVVGTKAMKLAIEKAKMKGVGIVGVNKSNHYGIAAHYAEMAVSEDMIGFSCSNVTPLMPAPGGACKAIGNNPFAFAFPAEKQLPIVFDAACSIVAQGKIIVAKSKGVSIPEGWAVDQNGKPTTDPEEALKGFILPAAGPKGYGLAIIMEMLAGVLTGAAVGQSLTSMYDFGSIQNCGHLFVALGLDNFGGSTAFKRRVDDFISELKNGKKAEETDEIFMPGEIELKNEIRNKKEGIIIPKNIFVSLQETGKKYGVTIK